MSKHLKRDLETLDRDVLTQSSVVEEMIRVSIRALAGGEDAADEVLRHEPGVNQREVRIEEECLKILALHQPVAVDLRRVATVLKVNSDLERIADLAVNIVNRGVALQERPPFALPPTLEKMGDIAIEMLRDALDALVDLDAEAARRVRDRDDEVDDLNREIVGGLQDRMRDDPDAVEAAMQVFSASRHIERIADHATNIAEDVVYLVEGEIARHGADQPDDAAPPDAASPKPLKPRR